MVDILKDPCCNYLQYIDQWYPLPEFILDELRKYIVDYAFDPTRDPWWHDFKLGKLEFKYFKD